jgi:hypothetical protein
MGAYKMRDYSQDIAFNQQLRDGIFSAIIEAHKVSDQGHAFINNGVVINALLDVIAVHAAAYGFEDYTPEELVHEYMSDLPRRIALYRDWHRSNGTTIVRRSKIN